MNQSRRLSASGRQRHVDGVESPAIPLVTVNAASLPSSSHNNSPISTRSSPDTVVPGDPERLNDLRSQRRQNTTGSDHSNTGGLSRRPRSTATSENNVRTTSNETDGAPLIPPNAPNIPGNNGQTNGAQRGRRTEQTTVDRKDLGMWDVAALIINKQLGTGIYTTPGLVLSLTGSKTISLGLWLVGGIWAMLSVVIYVEFGVAFPFNGGELIYLDEVFKRPELLATILFSSFFVLMPNSDGNALQFAKHVLLTYMPDAKSTEELSKPLITLLGILVLTFVCLIHYFSRNSGLFLNKAFGLYKIIFVFAFIIAGFNYRRQQGEENRVNDWGVQRGTASGSVTALIYVIYSYQGWENANYVGGELKIGRTTLRNGACVAVTTTTVLYMLATSAYFAACPYEDLAGQDLGVISNFAPKVFPYVGAVKVGIALSAFGNILAVVYTSARVKQQIARQCIIPFYKFFSRDDKQFGTPAGALILHWIFAAAWLIATPNTSSGYGFIIGNFIYGQLVIGLAVGIAFFRIKQTYESGTTRSTPGQTVLKPTWRPVVLGNAWARAIVGAIFVGMNLLAVIESARGDGSPPRWAWPVVLFGLLLLMTLYWAVLSAFARWSKPTSTLHVRIAKLGGENVEEDAAELERVRLENNSRIVVYKTNGWLKKMLGAVDMVIHFFYRELVAR